MPEPWVSRDELDSRFATRDDSLRREVTARLDGMALAQNARDRHLDEKLDLLSKRQDERFDATAEIMDAKHTEYVSKLSSVKAWGVGALLGGQTVAGSLAAYVASRSAPGPTTAPILGVVMSLLT